MERTDLPDVKERAATPQRGGYWLVLLIALWTGNVLIEIILERWHVETRHPWNYVISLLVYVSLGGAIQVSSRRWPKLFKWPDHQVSRWTSLPYAAWSQKGLAVLFVPLVTLVLLATIPQGLYAVALGLGTSAGIALFLWFFLSLGESWAKRYGGPTFFDSCLFVILMGLTLLAIGAALMWLFSRGT